MPTEQKIELLKVLAELITLKIEDSARLKAESLIQNILDSIII